MRLCATITGSGEAAEDLAQETSLEAWRHLEGLRDPEKRAQWLSGNARNICRRWNRQLLRLSGSPRFVRDFPTGRKALLPRKRSPILLIWRSSWSAKS